MTVAKAFRFFKNRTSLSAVFVLSAWGTSEISAGVPHRRRKLSN
jgi:hypothetical protein